VPDQVRYRAPSRFDVIHVDRQATRRSRITNDNRGNRGLDQVRQIMAIAARATDDQAIGEAFLKCSQIWALRWPIEIIEQDAKAGRDDL
jgi:hypothetical protein